MIVVYILAVIGVIAIVDAVVKGISLAVLRAEHQNDKVQYAVYSQEGNLLWRSRVVDEFTADETSEFKTFCKEWAKVPGSIAKWDRITV
jgi:hypothetical protein